MIENELLEPVELISLMRSYESNEFCIDCQTMGHLNWDGIRKDAMKQMYICAECSDALALVEFAHDMIRVIKQKLEPRYPKNFQHWINLLMSLQKSHKLRDSYQLDDIGNNEKILQQIMNIKDKKIEYSFCSSRPHDIRKGEKGRVEVPEPCKHRTIIHNHPSGNNDSSEKDRVVACENNSVLCTVTPEKTVCYAPCTNEIVEEIYHGQVSL